MARRWFISAALAVLTAGALTVSMTGLGAASASPTRPAAAAHASATAGTTLPISVPATLNGVTGTLQGTVPGFTTTSGHVIADLAFTRFTPTSGTSTPLSPAINTSASVISAATSNVCKILNLTLGPLHLNLLGLVIDLNRVHLTITAVGGPGNLLGNLLCAVANLLNGTAPAVKQAALLNDVLGTLSILGRL